MTAQKELKSIVRQRQNKTGESYTAARAHVMRARAEMLGIPAAAPLKPEIPRIEAIVLCVTSTSARVRIPDENTHVTFRSSEAEDLIPGHIATLLVRKRWTWRGDAYASGEIESTRIDIPKLALDPLPLHDLETENLRDGEPFRSPDPYASFWRKLTAKPRISAEMDPIAWGAFPNSPEDNLTCDASELAEDDDIEGARLLLMKVLRRDIRCIDAHALLGTQEFDFDPARAILHFEVGVRIGELSLPEGFDGVLLWARLYNRAFLRCLKGFGLCLWRLGHSVEAQQVFERILSYNPNDNQGIRFCWQALKKGLTWEQMDEQDRAERFGQLN